MENFEIFIIALFVSVAGLNVLARWLSVPYPIPLVLGGLALGLIPGMPGDRAGARPGAADLPAAAALRGGVLLRPARAARTTCARSRCIAIGLVLADDRRGRRARRTR